METHIDKKFYVPDITEFHVGFEYEWKGIGLRVNDDGEWRQTTIKDTSSLGEGFKAILDGGFYRVKYLDREDIESLGWKYIEDRDMSENYGFKFSKNDPRFHIAKYELYYWTTHNRAHIVTISGTIFEGTIKNKSELKVLLKQLGIE